MEGKQAKAIGQEEPAYARINGVPIDLYSDNIYGVLRELCKYYEYSDSVLEADSEDDDIEEIILNGNEIFDNKDMNIDNNEELYPLTEEYDDTDDTGLHPEK